MTNKIIIDGWNVCWKIPDIAQIIPQDLAQARFKFNALVKNFYSGKNIIYKIIYDGQPGIYNTSAESYDQSIQFSKNPQSADQKILKFLRIQKDISQWTVVTSDRELAGRAKNLGAKSLSSEQFIQKLQKHKQQSVHNRQKENPNLSKDEIKSWIKLFNNQE